MKILVEVTHPAHVHFFRNAIGIWKSRGYKVAVTARDKEIVVELLKLYGIEHAVLSGKGRGKLSLFSELIKRDYNLWRFCREFKPDVLTAIGGVFAAHVGWIMRKPVIVWDDTEHAGISHKMTFPFVTSVYTPDCYTIELGKKQIRYAGYHELAYLHPNRFTPDKNVLRDIGIDTNEKYCLVRFVSWQAHHDIGQHGFTESSKVKFVDEVSKYAKVYITSESALPEELEKYRLRIPVHLVHYVTAYAALYVGEGATMATESAILGVPAVYVNTLESGNISTLERYGLAKQVTDANQALQCCIDWLCAPDAKEKCIASRKKLLEDKIDVTDYVVGVISSYMRD